MPSFLRHWVAREGHEVALRRELLLVHETYTRRNPHVMESLMYREHFLGSEFLGLFLYDSEPGLWTRECQATLARMDEVAAAHAKTVKPSLRVEMIGEFVSTRSASLYGVAGLLTCPPVFATEFAKRLDGLVAELVKRLGPTRMLVGEAVDKPGLFFVLGDSNYPVDLGRYLRSSLHRQHRATLEPLLAAPARWFSLDPIWRYFGSTTEPASRAKLSPMIGSPDPSPQR